MNDSQKLGVLILAKNEENNIGDCIDSVAPIASKIIVIDTGSKDKTKQISRRHGALVLEFPWCDNFSSCRNYGVNEVGTKWILSLDADERLSTEGHKDVLRFIERVQSDCGGAKALLKTYGSGDTSPLTGWRDDITQIDGENPSHWFPDVQIRLFRGRYPIRFRGYVFESVERSIKDLKLSIAPPSFVIHHFPRTRSHKRRIEKLHLYLNLCDKNIENGFDVAKSYLNRALINKSFGVCGEVVMDDLRLSIENDSSIASTHYWYGCLLEDSGYIDEAIIKYREAVSIYPKYRVAKEALQRLIKMTQKRTDQI